LESYMPLARYALYAQGIEMYLAADVGSGRDVARVDGVTSRARAHVGHRRSDLHASEGRPGVVSGTRGDVSDEDEWLNSGDAIVVDPTGTSSAGRCIASARSFTPSAIPRRWRSHVARSMSPATTAAGCVHAQRATGADRAHRFEDEEK